MIPKIIRSDSYNFGEVPVALVPLHRHGVDHDFMLKRASSGMFEKEIGDLKSDKKKTVLHVLAVGDEESYGDNRNCDAFNEEDNKERHGLFKSAGHVFKNHKNWSPKLATGEVLATGHNDDMHRIELLIGLDNTKYAEELEAFEKGGDIPVSMGSMQDHDVCSICGHKAPTSKQHCEHIKEQLGEVLEDGRKVYMKNPKPNYFDISTVMKPADRIGYSLRKVAAEQGIIGGHELAEEVGLRPWTSVKHATLVRLAEMEKRISGMGKVVDTSPSKLSPDAKKQLKQACTRHGVSAVLGTLHESGFLLSFDDFSEVMVGKSKLAMVDQQLTGGFSRLLESDDSDFTSLEAGVRDESVKLASELSDELYEKTSMSMPAVSARVVRISIVDAPKVKLAAVEDTLEARGLSELYLHYKLAFASHESNRHNPATLQAVVLSNPSTSILRPLG